MDVPEIKAMLELYPVGQIFDNHVYPGVLHNAFVDVGIPAFTPESALLRPEPRIDPAVRRRHDERPQASRHRSRANGTYRQGRRVFVGNSAFPILATAGGFVEHLVKLNDTVEVGQKVAVQRNSFGEVVAEYTSSVAGEITGQRSDGMSEPGNPLTFILFNKPTPDGVEIYPE